MGRAERRRLEKEKSKAGKVYTLTQAQIDAIKAQAVDEAVSTGFLLMLAIPVMVLHDKYWVKTAKRKLPAFVDHCLDLWDSYNKGYVELEDLRATLWEEGGVKLERSGSPKRYYGGAESEK